VPGRHRSPFRTSELTAFVDGVPKWPAEVADLAPRGVVRAEVTCSAIIRYRDRVIPFDETGDGLWGACRGVARGFLLDHMRDLSVDEYMLTAESAVIGAWPPERRRARTRSATRCGWSRPASGIGPVRLRSRSPLTRRGRDVRASWTTTSTTDS
jgi:hypothetical protein